MVCAPVRSIISSLKLGDYLSVQAHKPCSISHLRTSVVVHFSNIDTWSVQKLTSVNFEAVIVHRSQSVSNILPRYLPYRRTTHGLTIFTTFIGVDLAQYEIFRFKVCNVCQGWYNKLDSTSASLLIFFSYFWF